MGEAMAEEIEKVSASFLWLCTSSAFLDCLTLRGGEHAAQGRLPMRPKLYGYV